MIWAWHCNSLNTRRVLIKEINCQESRRKEIEVENVWYYIKFMELNDYQDILYCSITNKLPDCSINILNQTNLMRILINLIK